MPRLRKVQYEKYKDLEIDFANNQPIDILTQEEIITNLKKKNNTLNSTNAKNIFRIYLVILLLINMILITVPYYRKGMNTFFSACACLMLFCPLLLAFSSVHSLDKYEINEKFFNVKIITYILVSYCILAIVKLVYYRTNIQTDLIYIIPILFGYCIIDIHNDNSRLSQAIEELETLKYNYKEA